MKKLKLALLLLLGFSVLSFQFAPSVAAFDFFGGLKDKLQGDVCNQDPEAARTAVCTESGKDNPISGTKGIILKGVSIFAIVGGIAAVVAITIGGLQYVLSTGDSARTNTAKNTILYAAIGLVVIIAGRQIIVFVINRL